MRGTLIQKHEIPKVAKLLGKNMFSSRIFKDSFWVTK
jgi:hypothetical protein